MLFIMKLSTFTSSMVSRTLMITVAAEGQNYWGGGGGGGGGYISIVNEIHGY